MLFAGSGRTAPGIARVSNKRKQGRLRRVVPAVLLAVYLLVSSAACSSASAELLPEEIQERLTKSISTIPSTELSDLQLSQTFSGEPAEYSAAIALIWNEEQGRISTEKALQTYSENLAAAVSKRTPGISALSLTWTVPYHSEEEPSMTFAYERKGNQLEQSAMEDRFTDGTFGADAFIDPDAPVTVPVEKAGKQANAGVQVRTPENAYYILTNLNRPQHKADLLPQPNAPAHKSEPAKPGSAAASAATDGKTTPAATPAPAAGAEEEAAPQEEGTAEPQA